MKKASSDQINHSSQNANEECRNVVNSSRNESNNRESGDYTTSSNNEELELEYSSVAIPLSNDDQQRLLLASSLAIDIFSDPNVAQEFTENPSAYMQMRDLSYEGDLDYGIIQMALAFADDGIRQAILNHDIEGFISQCQAHGISEIPSGVENVNTEEIRLLFESMGFTADEVSDTDEIVLFITFIAAINVIAVVDYLVAAIAEVYAAVELKVAAVVDNYVEVNGSGTYFDITEINPSPLSLWAITNDNIESSYIVLDEITETYFSHIDAFLENHSPEYSTNEEFKNRVQVLIKANLIKYLMQ